MSDDRVDVIVIGAGPAGRALAAALVDRDRRVAVVDPDPDRRWPATYGMWQDELPSWVCDRAPGGEASLWRGRWDHVTVYGRRRHDLERPYGQIANEGLASALEGGEIRRARVDAWELGPQGLEVKTSAGDLHAAMVVDASGIGGVSPPPRRPLVQAAHGWEMASSDLSTFCEPLEPCVLMDWRPPGGASSDATFLYVLDDGERALVEETSLARSPALTSEELEHRLRTRLGGDPGALDHRVEHVSIVMDLDLPRPDLVVPFGAAASFVHPATGYSLAASLRRAPIAAEAIDTVLTRHGPEGRSRSATAAMVAEVWSAVWPRPARRVRALHRMGLDALDRLDAEDIAEFFDAFFELEVEQWSAYLSIDAPPRAVAAAMRSVFSRLGWRIRRDLMMAGPVSVGRGVVRSVTSGTWRIPSRSGRTG